MQAKVHQREAKTVQVKCTTLQRYGNICKFIMLRGLPLLKELLSLSDQWMELRILLKKLFFFFLTVNSVSQAPH